MRLGVMCSGNGTNFENIVRTCREDEVVVMIQDLLPDMSVPSDK